MSATGIAVADMGNDSRKIYRIDGRPVAGQGPLSPGIYILKEGNKATKIIVQ